MSNSHLAVPSGQRVSFYQLFTTKNLRVEIPLLQRDYAQGRVRETEVREDFLRTLYRYLEEGIPFRDLDFVYGGVEQQGTERACFVPLDGQQRLTTLFLLHWYLAQRDGQAEVFQAALGDGKRAYFTYETRSSSREFCQALVQYRLDNAVCKTVTGHWRLSAEIKDQAWFYLSWQQDPTIQSMLIMLDAIHDQFKSSQGYFAKLIDADKPVITFLFLNLAEFNLADDLYIKMNARGKPLTGFESFKAQLEQKIKGFNWGCEYYLAHRALAVSGSDYFAHKMDTDWANLFWWQLGRTQDFDTGLRRFVQLHFANYVLLQQTKLEPTQFELLFTGLDKGDFLSCTDYESFKALSLEWVRDLMRHLDSLLATDPHTQVGIKRYLEPNPYYDEAVLFNKVVGASSSFVEKLRFHAFYVAVVNGKRGPELVDWVRVVFNLTEHSSLNSREQYHKALIALNGFASTQGDTLMLLKQGYRLLSFSDPQLFEERLKAHLFLRSEGWKQAILQLEQHLFFKGQVGFALRFAGVVDYFTAQGHVTWSETEDAHYRAAFQHYAARSAAVFSAIATRSADLDYVWERAVLSKGDYLVATTASRYNLLSAPQMKGSGYSWQRLLRLPLSGAAGSGLWAKRQDYVKAVLDDPAFDPADLRGSLESIALQDLPSGSMQWQHLFRKEPRLFAYCGQGFIMRSGEEVVLFKESQRNHKHKELYTQFLAYEIDRRALDLSPFSGVFYKEVRSVQHWNYWELQGFVFQGMGFCLRVFYAGEYLLFFSPKEDSDSFQDYPAALSTQLKAAGFERFSVLKPSELLSKWGYATEPYLATCIDYEQAIHLIFGVVWALRDLTT